MSYLGGSIAVSTQLLLEREKLTIQGLLNARKTNNLTRDLVRMQEPNLLRLNWFRSFTYATVIEVTGSYSPGPVHTTPEECTQVSLWRRNKCFPFTLRRTNLKTVQQQSPVILDLCFKKHSGREITWVPWRHRFQKAPFVFYPHENERSAFSNASGLMSVFEKLRFRDGLVDGRPNRRNKAAFSNSFAVVWTRLQR